MRGREVDERSTDREALKKPINELRDTLNNHCNKREKIHKIL